jgi:hypothetical protein
VLSFKLPGFVVLLILCVGLGAFPLSSQANPEIAGPSESGLWERVSTIFLDLMSVFATAETERSQPADTKALTTREGSQALTSTSAVCGEPPADSQYFPGADPCG